MNEEIRTQGRKLFEERLEFGKKYIVYPSGHEATAHALMDGHTHLIHTTSTSPRFFFTATQGGSGKTAATQLSWFFVQRPVLATEAGAGLLYKLKDETLPTILFDEAQDVFGPTGNEAVRSLLNSYTAGIPRPISAGNLETIDLDLFCPVIMNGLTTKYDLPANFLERCIQTKLKKKLASEKAEDFDFVDLRDDIGEDLRTPRVEWSKLVTKADVRAVRGKINAHLKDLKIDVRDKQLWRPLIEYAYFCGDDIYETAIETAKAYIEKPDVKKLTLREQLLEDSYEVCVDRQAYWFFSEDLSKELRALPDSPWPTYQKGKGLNEHNLSWLLREYGISPTKDSKGSKRGYYMKSFVDSWQRVLGKDEPEHLKPY